jgi:heme/copper-type cytochrome/quinol oxidase subunit 1
VIGRLYIVFATLLSISALGLSAVIAAERIDPRSLDIFTRASDAGQADALAVWGLMFCGVLPLLAGIALAIVPLQVGARQVAFPRAAALSFWIWLMGSGVFIGSVIANGGPGGGDNGSVRIYLLSLGAIAIGLCIAAVCIATTVLGLRAPGLRLDRMPFFSWASAIQSVMVLAVLPALIGELVFQYVDHRYGRIAFGGSKLFEVNLQWVVRQPTSGLMVIPALGLVADVIPVMTKVRPQMRGGIQAAIALAGLVSFGVFAQDQISDKVTTQLTFILISFAAIVPALVVLATSLLGLGSGKPQFKAPLLWSVLVALAALVVAAGGALYPIKGLGLVGTAFEQAQFDVSAAVGLMAGLAALVYWAPKLWGRLLPDAPTSALALLAFIGAGLVGVAGAVAGFVDQPRGDVLFKKESGTALLNTLTTVGYGVLALTALLVLLLVARSAMSKSTAADDPWGGQTLEWATSSPPAVLNFTKALPAVNTPTPVLDAREAQ